MAVGSKPKDYNPAKDPSQDAFDELIEREFSPDEKSEMENRASEGSKQDLDMEDAGAAPTREGRGQGLGDLKNREEQVGSPSGSSSDVDDIGNKEEQAGWEDKTSEQGAPKRQTFSISKALMGKGGVAAIIGATIAFLGLVLSFVLGALGLIGLKEDLVAKISPRMNEVMTRRATKVMAKRLSADLTSGCTIKIKCRYRGFSNREINKFNRRAAQQGFRFEKVGRSPIPPFRNKVKLVEFDAGKKSKNNPNPPARREIPPDKLRSELRKNAALRKGFDNYHKSNVEFYSGKVAKGVYKRTKSFLGKRKTSQAKGANDAEREAHRQRELTRKAASGEAYDLKGKPVSSTAGAGETDEQKAAREDADKRASQLNDNVRGVIQEEADKLNQDKDDYTKNLADPDVGTQAYNDKYAGAVSKVEKLGSGIGGALRPLGAIQNICMIRMLVAAVDQSRAIAQALQLMRFAVMYVSLADRIKAGEADGRTTEQISDLMNMITRTDSAGFTGFDSMGFNWVSNGSVQPTGGEDYGKYQNGGPPPGVLGGAVNQIVNLGVLKSLCAVAFSDEALVITIGLTVAGLFTGGISAALQNAAFRAAKEAAETAVEKQIQKELADQVLKQYLKKTSRTIASGGAMVALFTLGVPPLIAAVTRATTGTTVTGDERGRDGGNAVVSGFGATNSQVSKAQGMQFVNADEAVEQDKSARGFALQQAKDEGINQFDLNNQYSFAHKVATSLAPSTSKLSSVSSVPTAIASIGSSAIRSVSGQAQAVVDPKHQYEFCKDPDLEKVDTAGDPFCNPQLGFALGIIESPNYDPELVVEYMFSNGYIDEEGEPIDKPDDDDDYADFIKDCLESDAPTGADERCADDAEHHVMMRVYRIDDSVHDDMQDEAGGNEAADTEDESGGGTVGGDVAGLAQQILDLAKEGKIALGHNDFGNDSADRSNPDENIEDLAAGKEPNTTQTRRCTGGQVNATQPTTPVDVNLLKFIVDLAQSGQSFGISALVGQCHSGGSEHYSGKAVDIVCPSPFDVSKADSIGSKYGIKRYSGEACGGNNNHYHYSTTGG